MKKGKPIKKGSAVAYAWLLFRTDYNGYPTVKWITPKFEDEINEMKAVELF